MVEKYSKPTSKPLPPYQTILERHPTLLRTIGTLSVEVVNLEIMLADLLAAILVLPQAVGREIYFTPNATTVRLNILLNASLEILAPFDRYRDQVKAIVGRAKAVFGKRNEMMHEAWGIASSDAKTLTRRKLPFKPENPLTPASVAELSDAINRARFLITSIMDLTFAIEDDEHYATSIRKYGKQAQDEAPAPSSPPTTQPPKPRRPT